MKHRPPLIAPVLAVAMLIGWLRLSTAMLTIVLVTLVVLVVALMVWRWRRRS